MTSAQPTTGRFRAADRAGLIRLALAGDTMLGRGVAERLSDNPRAPLVAPEVAEAAASADRFVLNLECCISGRGERFADPRKPFFFRAPPVAAQRLAELGVDAVTLANNHALDYGPVALLDTLGHLDAVGIAHVGAGADLAAARAAVVLDDLRIVAASDHPAAFAATADRPGVAYGDLRGEGVPVWLLDAARAGPDAETVLVTPHWGPNMQPEPLPAVREAAAALVAAGATLVAGHSAHVFQGVAGRVLYDLGDFLDDYAVDNTLRNDLGLLWLVDIDKAGPSRIEAVPLKLDFCRTRRATGDDARWIARRFTRLCARLGTEVREEDGRLVIDYEPDARATDAT
jgi:poly-gamma-glutamate capsule biosynthesis protein CapA/YwtB (metallophosphatase superfamily)